MFASSVPAKRVQCTRGNLCIVAGPVTTARGLTCLLPFLLLPLGCGNSDSGDDCTPPKVVGNTPWSDTRVSMTIATATVYGSGLLPPETRDGLVLWLNLDDGTSLRGVFTRERVIKSCGRSFSFRVEELPAGTYRLGYELADYGSSPPDPIVRATSTNYFTLSDGETVEFTPTF
jgi:hypothetical protein